VSINTDAVNPPPRRPRGRPALPVERIVTAAVGIVDERGAEALSMRSVAQRLESGTATLYRHFSNRSDLVSAVIDQILGEIDFDTGALVSLPWQEACTLFAQNMFDALSRHGNIAALMVDYIPMGPNALILRERCLSVLLANGFVPAVAAHAYATLARYVLGFAIQQSAAAKGQQDPVSANAFRRLDPTVYPATVTVSSDLPVALTDEFAFGLQLIIAGLELRHN
jgi:AcrR family transcriptional regulator